MCEECKLLRPQVAELQEKLGHLCTALLMNNWTDGPNGRRLFTAAQRKAFAESVPVGMPDLPDGGGSLMEKPLRVRRG